MNKGVTKTQGKADSPAVEATKKLNKPLEWTDKCKEMRRHMLSLILQAQRK